MTNFVVIHYNETNDDEVHQSFPTLADAMQAMENIEYFFIPAHLLFHETWDASQGYIRHYSEDGEDQHMVQLIEPALKYR